MGALVPGVSASRTALAGRTCHIALGTTARLTVVMAVQRDASGQVDEILSAMPEGARDAIALCAFEVGDWNADLTPWPAKSPYGGSFAGGAPDTLEWAAGELLPRLDEMGLPARKAIAGYSLSGLFALWATGEAGAFSSCASVSGSLWYPGFAEGFDAGALPRGCGVYLSLGEREERARQRQVATVGDATRKIAAKLKAAPNVARTALVWNPGGHFDDAAARVARALAWLAGGGEA